MSDSGTVPPLGIVVVNFGSHQLLADNLGPLDPGRAGAHVVVVDSYHSEVERRAVRALADEHGWDLVEPGSNVGFGAGMNLGVARARRLGCGEFLLLNPDVEIGLATMLALRDQGRSAPMTMASPLVVRPDGTPWFRGSFILLDRGRTGVADGRTDGARIPWLSGACLLVPGRLWEALGGFDEDFFLYWEDVDLSFRCQQIGGQVLVRDDLRVLHAVGGTQGGGRAKSALYYYYNARNRLLFAAKHLPTGRLLRWVFGTVPYAREVVLRGGRRQFRHPWAPISSVLRGSLSGLLLVARRRILSRAGRLLPGASPPADVASRPGSLRIALIGTRGVPARYGGFETCVEEVGWRLVERGHQVVVYCRNGAESASSPTHYRGMRLVHLPAARKRSLETLSHTALSALHLVAHRVDVAVMFNAANAIWLPLLRLARIPTVTHVDGLEWKRAKWGRIGRNYYRKAEAVAVRWSDAVIADAPGIADHYRSQFGAATELIAYGAPLIDPPGDGLAALGLLSKRFHLVVARFEPENHVDVIVDGYRRSPATLPLVVVGSAPYADAYTASVQALADERVTFLGGVWDQDLLDQLYAHCLTYLHGHSVGGTNPSLLRAIGAGAATLAYDVVFNRGVLGAAGWYFRTPADLAQLLAAAEGNRDAVAELGSAAQLRAKDYDWDDVAARYEALCRRLSGARL